MKLSSASITLHSRNASIFNVIMLTDRTIKAKRSTKLNKCTHGHGLMGNCPCHQL